MSWPLLERRIKAARARAAVRAWEYRQRDHAHGAWFRLRRALVDAAEAWATSATVGRELIARGFVPHPVGAEFEPQRLIFFVPGELPSTLPGTRPVAVGLGADLLGAECVLLVPFASRASAHGV